MSYKEIVTLQVGHYSNFVGAHWWNIQESGFVYDSSQQTLPKEICHDVLFREGESRRKEVTFTPRLIAFDLKGSLRTLKQEGTLYEGAQDEGAEIRWLGDVTMHTQDVVKNDFLRSLDNTSESGTEQSLEIKDDDDKEEEVEDATKRKKHDSQSQAESGTEDIFKHKLYNLDKSVNVWSDFLRTHYHPKSIHVVEEYRHRDELRPFDLYCCGDELQGNYNAMCDWEDKLHHFTEECDSLQGFHVLMDTNDGFGGLGAGLLRYLDEEYPGKGILTFGFTPTDAADDSAQARATRIINSALCYDKVSTHSSLFVPASLASSLWRNMGAPIKFPHLEYKSIAYHTSAVLAASLDTLSQPYRLDSGAIHMQDITHSFNAQGRKVASVSTQMPLGLYDRNDSLVDLLHSHADSYPWQSLTPHVTEGHIPMMQSVVLRGIPEDKVPSAIDMRKLPEHLRGVKSRREALQSYLSNKCRGSLFSTHCLETPLKTAIPFPHIFKDNVNKHGCISSEKRSEEQGVDNVPMMTSFQCNTGVGGVIEHLHGAAAKMNIKKHHRYIEMGVEEDDYSEVLDNLQTLAGNYKTESI